MRTASHANPKLKERGYAGFLELSWDLPRDMMTASIHTVIPKEWPAEERQHFFHPESVQWHWPFPALAQFPHLRSAEEFYLRPDLYSDKFPQDRKITLSPELAQWIAAQEREGHLVFRQADKKPVGFLGEPAERKETAPSSQSVPPTPEEK